MKAVLMSLQEIHIVGAYDAKTHFSQLLERVESGEEITITKHGTPVARMVPVKKASTPDERRAAIQRWMETSKGLSLGGLKIRDLINEGRR
jgi:prevent-host-death family protein